MIKITNIDNFNMAQNAVSKDETRKYLCGVYLEADGTVTGTNGHMLTTGNAIDADEMEGVEPFILKTKAFSSTVASAFIDLENKLIHTFNRKGAESLQLFEIIDAKFPEYKDIIPADDREGGIPSIGINPHLLAQLVKGTDKWVGASLKFGTQETDPILITYDRGLSAISVLMPMRL